MKKFFLVLLILFGTLSGYSQSADGRYLSRMTRDGMLYFIYPKKLGKLSGIKHFDYDVTLLNWTDSATINFTFESKNMSVPESIRIIADSDTISCDSYSPLYIDIKKNNYEIRITSKFTISDIKKIFSSLASPVFLIEQDKTIERATYSENAWKKDRKKLIDILNLYNYSK